MRAGLGHRSVAQQAAPRHCLRLLQPENGQQRRGNVGKPSILQGENVLRRVDEHQRYRVGGMRGVRLPGLWIAHHLDIAVVGGDEDAATRILGRGG